jgi:hypothetical protein
VWSLETLEHTEGFTSLYVENAPNVKAIVEDLSPPRSTIPPSSTLPPSSTQASLSPSPLCIKRKRGEEPE